IAGLFLALASARALAAPDAGADLPARVASALESGSAAALSGLFPTDRKVAVSLDQIADLRGFVGPGPLVEALRRYLGSRVEVSFTATGAGGAARGAAVRVKGTLASRDRAGKRDRVGLVFVFERIDDAWRAVEVRETG